MGYRFDNLRLEKGMYNEAGRSFTQVLEREDPSEQYKGTALEGLVHRPLRAAGHGGGQPPAPHHRRRHPV